jgi:hypothetical protein
VIAFGGCADVVADDQVSYTLTAVDERPLPAILESSAGTTTVIKGILLGAPSEDECEYHLQLQRGNTQSNLDGPVFDCTLKQSGAIVIRIDVGTLTGAHDFHFAR